MALGLPERITHGQTGEAGEIPVERPELTHSVLGRKSRDMRIVDEVSDGASGFDRPPEMAPMFRAFSEEHQSGRGEKRLDVLERGRKWSRRIKDPRMSDHAKELVDAGPRKCPRRGSFRERPQEPASGYMVLEFLAPRVKEDVRVEGDQRRPSIRSKRASRSSIRAPGCNRPLSVRQRRR
jgi:hypothetical protein